MHVLTPLIVGLLALFTLPSLAKQSDAKQAFIDDMVKQHGFSAEFVSQQLKAAQKNQQVLDAIARPWEAKPWYQYYPIFITEKRINKGVGFWQQHQQTLQRAERELGIPAEIIVAIIGVETYFGTYKGKYPVLDALYTLAFYYPPRSKFFKSELKQFFLMSQEEQLSMRDLKGSYAGAMGWGQFISSSYRHYAIDFDNDGVRDLFNNPIDAIGSVANYFKAHGWRTGQPVAFKAKVSGDGYGKLLSKSLKLKHSWKTTQAAGVTIPHTLSDSEKVKLMAFKLADGEEYWLGLHNFYVITRYNHSPLYAMAVYQLSQHIKTAYQQSQ